MLRKKQLALAVALASGLGLSAAAFANGGTYMASPMPQSNPSDMSIYAGVDVGLGDNHWNNVEHSIPAFGDISTSDRYGFAAGAHLGFQFNQFFAVQAGYTYLPTAKATSKFLSETASGKINNYAVDMVGKLMSPTYDGMGVFGKLGLGYLHSHDKDQVVGKENIGNVGLVYGAGVFYTYPELIQNVVFNVSWTRFDGNPKSGNDYQPYQDFYALGVDYHFPISG